MTIQFTIPANWFQEEPEPSDLIRYKLPLMKVPENVNPDSLQTTFWLGNEQLYKHAEYGWKTIGGGRSAGKTDALTYAKLVEMLDRSMRSTEKSMIEKTMLNVYGGGGGSGINRLIVAPHDLETTNNILNTPYGKFQVKASGGGGSGTAKIEYRYE